MEKRFTTHGDFSWSELMTRDPEGAKTFYGELLEWDFEDVPMANGNYTVVKADGKRIGGMMPMPQMLPKGTPSHWGVYITVDNVEAIAEKADELGANILLPPTDIPGMGRFMVLQDPQGAVISLIQYEEAKEQD